MTRPQSTRVQLSALGGLALACVPALILLAVLRRPVWDVDIFWQLRLGELILTRGGPVGREPFAATHLGEALPSFAWAAQAIMAQVRLWLGWSGLALFNALCWTGAFLLAGRAAMLRGCTRETIALALAAALTVSVPGASIRPQTLGLLAFGALVWVTERRGPAWHRVLAGAVLLLAWQNLHPSAIVGLAWLGARGARAGWSWWRGGADHPDAARFGEMALLTAIAGLALLATPDGIGFLQVAAGNTAVSQALRVTEWLPLWAPENRIIAAVVVVNAAIVLVLARRARTIDWDQMLPWLALLGLTIVSARIMLFWAVALVPVLAGLLPRLEAKGLPRWTGAAIALLAGLAFTAVQPARFRETIPVAQIDALHATGVRGTIFAHFPWGGAVIDRGYPHWKVAYDGRYYRYTAAEWQRYLALGEGRVGLAEIERIYRPAAFVLDSGWTPGLIGELRARPDRWRELPGAGPAILFVPAGAGRMEAPQGTGGAD